MIIKPDLKASAFPGAFSFFALIFIFTIISLIAIRSIFVLIIGLILMFLVSFSMGAYSWAEAKKTQYDFTPDSIVYTEGFLTQVSMKLPYERISTTSIVKDWFWDNLFKTGSITIATQGYSGLTIRRIKNSDQVHNEILKLIKNGYNKA